MFAFFIFYDNIKWRIFYDKIERGQMIMEQYDYHHLEHVKIQNRSKKTLWMTLGFTLFFTIVEVVGGILSNSLALLSDSAHMASDVLALGLSMAAIYMATKKSTKKYTFGYLRFEIIASFLNGLALVVIAIGIFIEGIQRMVTPQALDLKLMLTIALIGFVVNIILTFILSRSIKDEENLNIKSALWHFIGDLLSSIGIIVSAVIIYFTGFTFMDPIISMVIGGIICTGGVKIIKASYLILMETVPEQFDLDEIRKEIKQIEGINDVHEFHLWSISTDHYSLTAHIFIGEEVDSLQIINQVNTLLKEKYEITHTTIQVERPAIHNHGIYGKQFMKNEVTN